MNPMIGAWMPRKVLQMLIVMVLGLAFMPLGIAHPHVDSGLVGSANDVVISNNNTALFTTLDCNVSTNIFQPVGNIAFAVAKHIRTSKSSTVATRSKPIRSGFRKNNPVTTTVDGATKTTSLGPTITNGSFITTVQTTKTFTKPFFTGTPPEFMISTHWSTPSAPPCTDGPQPSVTATVGFDDIQVTWWYAVLPTNYANTHLRNTYVMDSRIVDEDWEDLSQSKPNFAVHPGLISNNATMRGAFDESGFFSIPDGGTFDVVGFWVQCERFCEFRVYETGFDWVENELLALDTATINGLPVVINESGRLVLDGGVGFDGMVYLNLEETYGWGAARKVRWLRYWARDLREEYQWSSPVGEIAISLDDLVIVRRESGPGCAEPKPTRDADALDQPEKKAYPTSPRRRSPQYGTRFNGNLRRH
ncbi:hypothetical protein DFH27DRAFT_614914 [Peziza echinospora]|nr:hypothetical protein DFH27DRAFT_614914 [Peziza echinospora]